MSTYDGRKPEPPYPTPDDIESLRDDIESLRDDIESLRDDIESLREAAKLSEARARVCEAWKNNRDATHGFNVHDATRQTHTYDQWQASIQELDAALAALAAAEKGGGEEVKM